MLFTVSPASRPPTKNRRDPSCSRPAAAAATPPPCPSSLFPFPSSLSSQHPPSTGHHPTPHPLFHIPGPPHKLQPLHNPRHIRPRRRIKNHRLLKHRQPPHRQLQARPPTRLQHPPSRRITNHPLNPTNQHPRRNIPHKPHHTPVPLAQNPIPAQTPPQTPDSNPPPPPQPLPPPPRTLKKGDRVIFPAPLKGDWLLCVAKMPVPVTPPRAKRTQKPRRLLIIPTPNFNNLHHNTAPNIAHSYPPPARPGGSTRHRPHHPHPLTIVNLASHRSSAPWPETSLCHILDTYRIPHSISSLLTE